MVSANSSTTTSRIWLFSVIIVGCVLAAVLIGVVLLQNAFHVKNASIFQTVVGRSMLPTFQLGDMIVIRNDSGFSFDDVKIGDVIVFRTRDPEFQYNNISTHRVVSMYTDRLLGEKVLVTKGDNNKMPEPLLDYPILSEQYIGKVAYHLPQMGWLRILSFPHTTNPIDTQPTPEQIMREANMSAK